MDSNCKRFIMKVIFFQWVVWLFRQLPSLWTQKLSYTYLQHGVARAFTVLRYFPLLSGIGPVSHEATPQRSSRLPRLLLCPCTVAAWVQVVRVETLMSYSNICSPIVPDNHRADFWEMVSFRLVVIESVVVPLSVYVDQKVWHDDPSFIQSLQKMIDLTRPITIRPEQQPFRLKAVDILYSYISQSSKKNCQSFCFSFPKDLAFLTYSAPRFTHSVVDGSISATCPSQNLRPEYWGTKRDGLWQLVLSVSLTWLKDFLCK